MISSIILNAIIPTQLIAYGVKIAILILLAPLIEIGLLIILYEALVRFDIGRSLTNIAHAILHKNPQALSLLPSLKGSSESVQTFSMDTPFRVLINVNRALLYLAFFLALISNPLLSFAGVLYSGLNTLMSFASFGTFVLPAVTTHIAQAVVIGGSWTFINTLIMGLEPLVISVLLTLVILNYLLDIYKLTVT